MRRGCLESSWSFWRRRRITTSTVRSEGSQSRWAISCSRRSRVRTFPGFGESNEQGLELRPRQVDVTRRLVDAGCDCQVKRPAKELAELALVRLQMTPSRTRRSRFFDPCQQLALIEGLGDIIIGADLQPTIRSTVSLRPVTRIMPTSDRSRSSRVSLSPSSSGKLNVDQKQIRRVGLPECPASRRRPRPHSRDSPRS